ncbi:MAG: hypothetical protein IKG65_08935 [Exiguobacterium sp.]|uniref:Uncharacterized protein n=1 Tax=Exiguobacterium profundum TaxID=307643 RepID=A0ABY8AZA6_9BACL|nr:MULTISPECIES: hypothetical protein [Exiguobacterium]MBR3062512.1 hypothetical protein [Exiguobacterium sp.]QLQ23017.1 MAG: hypothetical protein HZT42_13075 [Paracoccaceae bacterium]QPI67594.1 hypothetical protein IR194_14385 [Exiguobacterium sp. PBE]MBG0918840.1 hypothetical protein [Exiguobacterium sp. SRB7LM]MBR3218247.1 hypothetical protein [Exiguobacterium sp.]
MSTTEHEQATSILHHLFTASSFVGIDFGSGPNHHLLYFSRQGLESWISIEGPWHVHATQNTFDEGEQLEQLMRLRRERIHQVRLGDEHPHLELEFESGSLLFINGYQEHFECWQAGDARPLGGDAYLLVAMPQGELAIFADGDDE